MKRCYRCKRRKPLSKFYSDKTRADGKGTKCRKCAKAFALRIEVTAPVDEKFCSCCEQTKPAAKFHKHKRSLDGLQSCCKKCRKDARDNLLTRACESSYSKRYRKAKPDVVSAQRARRRAREHHAQGSHTEIEWRAKLDNSNHACSYCGKDSKLVKDHDIPLSRGGSDAIENIVPACIPCNCSKQALTGDEFRRNRGYA